MAPLPRLNLKNLTHKDPFTLSAQLHKYLKKYVITLHRPDDFRSIFFSGDFQTKLALPTYLHEDTKQQSLHVERWIAWGKKFKIPNWKTLDPLQFSAHDEGWRECKMIWQVSNNGHKPFGPEFAK